MVYSTYEVYSSHEENEYILPHVECNFHCGKTMEKELLLIITLPQYVI